MLKSIVTTRSESTAKQENKASCNTNYIVPDLIDFFGHDWKKNQNPDWKKKYS